MVLIDAADRIAGVNAAARELLDLDESDVGSRLLEHAFAHRPVELPSRVEHVRSGGSPVALHDVELQAHDAVLTLDVRLSPLQSGAVAVAFSDATRSLRLAEALRRSTEEVELAHEQLRSLVGLLEAATHDVPQPVRALLDGSAAPERWSLESMLRRLPFAAVAVRRDRRVAFANPMARQMFGRDAVRPGSSFGRGALAELAALAEHLVSVPAPLPLTVVRVGDRTLRVGGASGAGDEPAVLFAEDVTTEEQHGRVMGEFLRNAAHQLRTPLAGIIAAVETLQSGAKDVPEDRDRFLDHVQTHADRLARIARGLLLLARSQAGEQLALDFVELCPALEHIVATAEPRDGVRVVATCPPTLAAIATPDLLHEALAALVDNAVVHTPHGTVEIRAVAAGDDVVITVADEGPGILPEFRDRVFEPFFRLAPSGDGYGLGLAIAAEALRAMHGSIDVSAGPDGGTVFTVRLPSANRVR